MIISAGIPLKIKFCIYYFKVFQRLSNFYKGDMSGLPSEIDGFYPEPTNTKRDKRVTTDNKTEQEVLQEAIGSSSFSSTKGKQVIGNEKGETAFKKERQHRQVLKQKKLYEIPLTKQQVEEKSRAANTQMQI